MPVHLGHMEIKVTRETKVRSNIYSELCLIQDNIQIIISPVQAILESKDPKVRRSKQLAREAIVETTVIKVDHNFYSDRMALYIRFKLVRLLS